MIAKDQSGAKKQSPREEDTMSRSFRGRVRHKAACLTSSAACAVMIAASLAVAPAWAQTTPSSAPATDPDAAVDQVEEVVVQGIRSSLNNALEIRRKSDVILDGISADDIGSTPDLNLGEALQ
ncbi:MAG: hypothetical protein ACT6RD_12575, partial [Brevundimonas sp.]|uniref:hypothetical protein n=1 Tax=Brevundimonas sp. TaxID=1871086 RepID=UPI004033DBB1